MIGPTPQDPVDVAGTNPAAGSTVSSRVTRECVLADSVRLHTHVHQLRPFRSYGSPQCSTRLTAIAFLVLLRILAAHTILETARDALFLVRLPASQLPWMYLAMAAIAVTLSDWSALRLRSPRALAILLAVFSAGTFLFW